jgi:hypothetical protein
MIAANETRLGYIVAAGIEYPSNKRLSILRRQRLFAILEAIDKSQRSVYLIRCDAGHGSGSGQRLAPSRLQSK